MIQVPITFSSFNLLNYFVSYIKCLMKVFELITKLLCARDIKEISFSTNSYYKIIITYLSAFFNNNHFLVEINSFYFVFNKIKIFISNLFSDWLCYMLKRNSSSCNFMEHWRKQEI